MAESLGLLPASYADFRRLAEKRLPRRLFDYADGGSGVEATLRENVQAFEQLHLRQRVLRDISQIDTSVELFGEKLSMPLVLAPVGLAGLYARRGEVQAKRAADAHGIRMTLSTVGICPIAEVVGTSETPLWFQLYMLRDRAVVSAILDRAWEAGVRTLLFTVDLNVLGARHRDTRNGMNGGAGLWGDLRAGPIDYMIHPRWLLDVGIRGRPHTCGNFSAFVQGGAMADFRGWTARQMDASVSWRDISWLRKQWRGTLVLKGLLDPDDAGEAVKIGADGLVVSNHGGRQLDGARSTAQMLPRIAERLGGSHPLLVDGGIRSGQDVVKALALGASAALIGRAWLFALAAQGERGLNRLLAQFRADIETTLGLTGCTRAADTDGAILDPD